MKIMTFFVPGIPKGQPRPRAFAHYAGKDPTTGRAKYTARMFDAGTAEGWKGAVAGCAKEFLPEVPTDLPVSMVIQFVMPRPKKHYTTKGLRPEAPEAFTQKPDADNLAKAVMDALTICGMWKDDSQIWDLRVTKKYGDHPGAQIIIEF